VKMRRKYKTDARTRACEVIKKYIHSRMMVETLEERELRNYKEFCHAIIQRADLFPPKNTCSFVQTMAEVYQLLDALHVKVLKESTTCATMLQNVLSLGKNLLSDVLGYLVVMVGSLPIKNLRSLEPVILWKAMNDPKNPLSKARKTDFGELVYGLLWCASPLYSLELEENSRPPKDVDRLLQRALLHVQTLQWHHTGVAPCLQKPAYVPLVEEALEVVRYSHQLAYFLANVVAEFARVGELFGDYGTITTSRVLHPLLDQLDELTRKLQKLMGELALLKEAEKGDDTAQQQQIDQLYVELDRLKENLFSIKTSWHKLVTNCCTDAD